MKKLISLVLALTIVLSAFMGLGFSVSAEDTDVLNVTVNGVTTQVPVGEKFTYYYTLSDLRIINVEAKVKYDSSKLKMTVVDDSDEDLYAAFLEQIFPVVHPAEPVCNFGLTDKLLYNFSSVKAYTFTEESVLTAFEFTVLEAGDVAINTDIVEMANSDKELIVDKTPTGSVQMKDYTSNEYIEYVAPEKPTEAPTEAPTQAPTEAPTQAPTEAPTQAPTEAPTQAPTEAPAPIKVENLTYNVASTNIEFTWDAVPGGVKYWVNKYNEETGTWASAASSRTTTALVKKLTPDTTYKFKMTCLLENGKMLTLDNADLYEVTTKKAATTTEITSVAEAIQVTLTWEPVEGATKYWVYKAKSEEGPYYIYNSSRTNSLLVKKLDPETDYYFKVTALTVENGISTISEVEYSPVCHTKTISGDSITTRATNVTSNSVKIDWTPYEGADKYWVWISETTNDTTKKDTDWTVVKSITDTSINEYTFSNLENGKTYFVTISARYYQADGTMMVIEYFPAQIMTKYSDSDMLTFEAVDDTTLKVSWDESIDVQKAWLFVYDENGNHLMNPSSLTNTVTIKNLAGMKDYTYHLRVLDNNGFYGYLTADSGEKYHE